MDEIPISTNLVQNIHGNPRAFGNLNTIIPIDEFPVLTSRIIAEIYPQYQRLQRVYNWPDLGPEENWRIVSHPYIGDNNGYGRPFIVERVTVNMIRNGIPNLQIMTREDAEVYIANPPERP